MTSQGKEVDMIHPLGKFACKQHMKQMDKCLSVHEQASIKKVGTE